MLASGGGGVPGLGQYGAFLQGDDVELFLRHARGSGLPLFPTPRVRVGDGWVTPAARSAR